MIPGFRGSPWPSIVLGTNLDFQKRLQELAARIHQGFAHVTVREAMNELYLWIQEQTGISSLKLRVDPPQFDEIIWESLETFANQRSIGMPFAYILGRVEFYGLELSIGPGVLIPRPETEELTDRATAALEPALAASDSVRVLDLCCGSGCIGIGLANGISRILDKLSHKCTVEIDLSDLSGYALEYARENARKHAFPNIVYRHFQGDLMEPIRKAGSLPYDLIVCNPPYIHPREVSLMSAETALHEPADALYHPDPPALYLKILKEIRPFLRPGGMAILELSPFIADVVQLLCESEFERCQCSIDTDLSGKKRYLIFACKQPV